MTDQQLTASEVRDQCVCLGVRRAARAVARRYDDAMRSLGITSGQFSILASLLREQAVALGALADDLGLDRTTLNRNLKLLEADGLVETVHDAADGRMRLLKLTMPGRDRLDRAIPIWRKAQAESHQRLGMDGWPEFRTRLLSLG